MSLGDLSAVRLLVVGDVMLDRYWFGDVSRISPEAPVPVVKVERCELISEAVRRAAEAARPGEVVLLSPACASYDQFRDYEKRGHHFRQMVGVITGCDTGEDGRSILP